MIEWIEYDNSSRDIESHITHLITDGLTVWTGFHASYYKYGYTWYDHDREPLFLPITHWAKINLPEQNTIERLPNETLASYNARVESEPT